MRNLSTSNSLVIIKNQSAPISSSCPATASVTKTRPSYPPRTQPRTITDGILLTPNTTSFTSTPQ